MPWLTVLFLGFTFSCVSEATHHDHKKLPSAVVVGTVFCDTCFQQDYSISGHFISGATVAVECKDGVSRPSFRKEVKTDGHGKFKVNLPFSVSKHVKRIKGCSVKLVSSSEPYCAVASSANSSSSLNLKSRKQGEHIFSAGFFSFKPLKQPSLCNQKPSTNRNSKAKGLNSVQNVVPPFPNIPIIPPPTPNNPIFPPSIPNNPIFPPPIPDPSTPFLPPLPQLPGLPPLPQLPPLPPLPVFPRFPPAQETNKVSNEAEVSSSKKSQPQSLFPPNPFQAPPQIPNPFQPPPIIPNPFQPPPLIPNPFQPPTTPSVPLPPKPGLTPPTPSFPFPFSPIFPFPPVVPSLPSFSSSSSSPSEKASP